MSVMIVRPARSWRYYTNLFRPAAAAVQAAARRQQQPCDATLERAAPVGLLLLSLLPLYLAPAATGFLTLPSLFFPLLSSSLQQQQQFF